ncbi:MAG: hypothetical protein KA154_10385 [Gemmatimonadaceae bacterium]|nr:hypothetical protein [Gemmatimonadaceae bacterium]
MFSVVSCSDPSGLELDETRRPTASESGAASTPLDLGERDLFELAATIPSYGGHFFDSNGQLTVWVADLAESDRARQALRSLVMRGHIRTSGRLVGGAISVRQGRFTVSQLAAWRSRTLGSRRLDGLVWVDLDERANRIALGVTAAQFDHSIEILGRELSSVGVPSEAIVFHAVGQSRDVSRSRFAPIARAITLRNTATTLGSFADTLVGGLRWEWRDAVSQWWGPCTIGFTAELSTGDVGFVSASHCSPIKFATDGNYGLVRQPLSGPTVGYERYDQQALQCPGFPLLCQQYRFSDANLNIVDARPVRVGYLARPSSRFHRDGVDTTLNPWGSYLRIDGTSTSIVQGSMVDHIGATRGWRYGEVEATCVTNYLDPWLNTAIRCAYKVDINVIDGDSGGPVFYYDYFGGAIAAGVLYRKDGDKAWFGKWDYVNNEVTGSWPAPAWIRIVANDNTPAPITTIVGPSEQQPGNSCYWYAATNFAADTFEWRVNGVVVGTNADLEYVGTTNFILNVQASNQSTGSGATLQVTVSASSSSCFVQ